MELYKEILAQVFAREDIHVTFPNLHVDGDRIVEMECYKALQKIKTIIDDDSLEDDACFTKIEEIVLEFERIGSDGGSRHDFG